MLSYILSPTLYCVAYLSMPSIRLRRHTYGVTYSISAILSGVTFFMRPRRNAQLYLISDIALRYLPLDAFYMTASPYVAALPSS